MRNDKTCHLGIARTAAAIIAALVSVVLAEVVRSFVTTLLHDELGVPYAAAFICDAIAGAATSLLAVGCICRCILGTSLAAIGLGRPKLNWVWVVSAFAMPAMLCCLVFAFAPGSIEKNSVPASWLYGSIVLSILGNGLCVGIIEEAAFRGVILHALETRCGTAVAIIASSLLFGLAHLGNGGMDAADAVQMTLAVALVGVLLAVVALKSRSVWNSALMHGLWNAVMCGELLHIGRIADDSALVNYIVHTDNRLLTGGGFGIEASMFAMLVFAAFLLLAIFYYKPHARTKTT